MVLTPEQALAEIQPAELAVADPVMAYIVDVVSAALQEGGSLREVFAKAASLAIELDYPRELDPFYSLHFAAGDLLHSEMQWYWPGATRQNIEEILRQEAERFMAAHSG